MAGENDRIYSWNPIYRTDAEAENFFSFLNRNGQFINRQIQIIGGGDPALDHQGHIVPQNILNRILDVEMVNMASICQDEEAAVAYVTDAARPQWMQDAYAYGNMLGIRMFDFDTNDNEDKFGTFFSIITWNPVNLCRAPSDDRRGGYPGNAIDTQVADYLRGHQVEQHVNANWMIALDDIIANTNNDTITAYLNACSATLDGQLTNGIGYYQFPWEYTDATDETQLAMAKVYGTGTKVLVPVQKK